LFGLWSLLNLGFAVATCRSALSDTACPLMSAAAYMCLCLYMPMCMPRHHPPTHPPAFLPSFAQERRSKSAMVSRARSVLGAAATTCGACAILCACEVAVFSTFGEIFLLLVGRKCRHGGYEAM
jgi:hypothetical protein